MELPHMFRPPAALQSALDADWTANRSLVRNTRGLELPGLAQRLGRVELTYFRCRFPASPGDCPPENYQAGSAIRYHCSSWFV
jgi:hypothetical protein